MRFLWVLALLLSSIGLMAHPAQQGSSSNEAQESHHSNELSDAHLTGDVRDAHTGEHIPFVYVTLVDKGIGSLTDAGGHFYLTNVPTGPTIIRFSMVGYQTVDYRINIKADSTYSIRPFLEEESVMLDNVVVTSNRYATKQKESASMVNVVSPILINRVTANSVGQALDYQTGLRLEENCQNCGASSVRINGLPGQYTQILLDSRPVFSSLASLFGLEQLPSSMVDRIEVIRGGGSALYGSNAVAGVVNIITKEPRHNSVRVGHTTSLIGDHAWDFNTHLDGTFVTSDSKIGLTVFANQHNRQALDVNQDGFTELPKLDNTTLGFRSYFKTSAYSKIIAEYHHLYEFRRGGDQIDKPAHEAQVAEQLIHHIDAGNLQFDWASKSQKHAFSLYTSLQSIRRDNYFGSMNNPNAYGNTNNLTVVAGGNYHLQWMQKTILPAHLSVGVEYSYDELTDAFPGYDRLLEQQVHLIGGYVQNEWKNEKLSLLIGARVDKHSLMKNVVCSPRATVRYTPIEGVILRANYSSGYRAPQAFDADLHVSAVNGEVSFIELDPDLLPEYSHSANLSVDLYKDFGDWATNLTVEGFFTKINDIFMLEENGFDEEGNRLFLRTNASGAYVGGLNVEGKLSYKNMFQLQFGYTFQQSKYDEPIQWSENPNLAPQDKMFRSPDHYGYILANVQPLTGFNISINGKLTGSMLVQHMAGYIPEDQEVTTPIFYDFGIKLSYDIPLYKLYKLQINAGVKNVFNSYQTDFDEGIKRDGGYVYGPSLPRTYFIGLQLNL